MIDFPDSFLRTFKLKMFIFSILIFFNLLPFQEVGRVIGIALMKQFKKDKNTKNEHFKFKCTQKTIREINHTI